MKNLVISALTKAVNSLGESAEIELTQAKGHGDFSTNVAMKLAKRLKDSPQNIANKIIDNLKFDFIKKAEVSGPGFINIFLNENFRFNILKNILDKNKDFGKNNQNKYINVEFISANPTGYLHIGHARNAVVGETLANILTFAGNKVDKEYYMNDAGNQISTLGISAYTRYQQELGINIQLPEDSYQGKDIIDFAKYYVHKNKGKYKNKPYEEVKKHFEEDAKNYMIEKIKNHLELLNIKVDIYFSEKSLYDKKMIESTVNKLSSHKYTYIKDGALWLKTSKLGDAKDRVLIKSDGNYTYLTPDIAYHNVKISRGYNELINIWGADHIGHKNKMEIALNYLGIPKNKIDILTIQLVKLIKNGKELKMSKRKGTSFWLKDLIDLVGKDAVRFHMINRANTTQFDFVLEEVEKQSSENPVFTIKYTHARANQLLNKSNKEIKIGIYKDKEIELINLLSQFPDLIKKIAKNHNVHLLPQYLIELAKTFNSFYSNSKIIGNKRESELLAIVKATKIVISNGLNLIGVHAPEKM